MEAESLIEAVDPATGLRRAQEALALSQETESIIGEALAERAIGRAIAASGENQAEALPHIKRSLEICENIGARFEIVRGLLAKGEALLACDNRTEAATDTDAGPSYGARMSIGTRRINRSGVDGKDQQSYVPNAFRNSGFIPSPSNWIRVHERPKAEQVNSRSMSSSDL